LNGILVVVKFAEGFGSLVAATDDNVFLHE